MTEPRIRRPGRWLSLLLWLLPHSKLKIRGLRLVGNSIGDDCYLGSNLVLGCGPFKLGDDCAIWNFNIFRNLSQLSMGSRSYICSWNQFTAAREYQRHSPYVGALLMGEQSTFTNRHYVDCSGQVVLRSFAGVGGIKSVFQSHEIDLRENKTTLGRVIVGENAMTGTNVLLLKDAYLPDRSILAAGSVLLRAKDGEELKSGLYGGTPARYLADIGELTWWQRSSNDTKVTSFDDTAFRAEVERSQLA